MMTEQELEREVEKLASDHPELSKDLMRVLLSGSVKVAEKKQGEWIQKGSRRKLSAEDVDAENVELKKGLLKLALDMPDLRPEILELLRGF